MADSNFLLGEGPQSSINFDEHHPSTCHNFQSIDFMQDTLPSYFSALSSPSSISAVKFENMEHHSTVPEAIEVDLSHGFFVTPEPNENSPLSYRRRLNPSATIMASLSIEPRGDGVDASSRLFVTPEPDERSPRSASQESDDSSDCMIIDETSCSKSARTKFAETKAKRLEPIVIEDEIVIKTEPDMTSPVSNISDIQRKIMQQFRTKKRKGGASTLFGSEAKRVRDNHILPKNKHKPRRPIHRKRGEDEEGVDVKEELDALMRPENDDDSWMNNDSGDQEESENFEKLRATLKAKQLKPGRRSEIEKVEIMRLEQQIALQTKRKEVAERLTLAEKQYTVSVSNNDDSAGSDIDETEHDEHRHRRSTYNQEAEDEYMARKVQSDFARQAEEQDRSAQNPSKKARAPRRKLAKTAREVQQIRREKELEKERRRRSRQAISKKGKKGGKAAEKKKYHKSRMTNGWEGGGDPLQELLTNLIHNDFIADRQAQEDIGSAPEINETVKSKHLAALLASVPEDYDTHKTRVENSDLKRASERFGFGKVKPSNGKWLLKGMKSPLYHHQLFAADWMVSKELGSEAPFGGINADQMGLGKTLETLATMVGNPPSKEEIKAKIKTTLLVLPSSAIRQWMDEIRNHVHEKIFPKIIHFKAKKEISLAVLKDCDIVLTSYHEVMNSFPFPSRDDLEEYSSIGGKERWMQKAKEITGDLHKIEWYRIVLDEAHAIKNFKSQTSLACQNLRGRFRWALSGTPIQNRLEELFPYFRFLRSPWTEDFDQFRKHFCDPNSDEANARIAVMLSIIMRRTMKDKILGRHIIDLPPIHSETKHILFSKEEKVLYRILEDRFRANLNYHFQKGTAQKNYNVFLILLLRLRQCTSHPFLLEHTIRDIFEKSDLMLLKSKLKNLSQDRRPIYEQVQQWIQDSEEEKEFARQSGEPTLGPGETVPFGQSSFGHEFRMGKFLDAVNPRKIVCVLCGDLPSAACITDCFHIFCKECMNNFLKAEEIMDGLSEFVECPDPECRKIIRNAQPYKDYDLQIGEEYGSSNTAQLNAKRSTQRRSRGSTDFDPFPDSSPWLDLCKNDKNKYLLPSTKMIALKAQIIKWFDDAPSDKIIVFTQFRMIAKIVGLIAQGEGWGHLFFTGNMTTDQRHEAVKKFHSVSEKRIMIANLKCGGQALNLTCANRVISVDLWWNHSVEMQAFGRVFRIGQHKETYVSRFAIRNSVDMRLLDLQADKIRAIDRAMQDTADPIVKPLSITDLASLFGHLRKEEDGTFQVEADYNDEDDEVDEVDRVDKDPHEGENLS